MEEKYLISHNEIMEAFRVIWDNEDALNKRITPLREQLKAAQNHFVERAISVALADAEYALENLAALSAELDEHFKNL